MPLYEYACKRCGKVFEVIQKFSDTPLEVHEDCGGVVERLISASAFKFKGSGWYVNDYGGSKNASNGAAKTESKATESKATEAKPQAKTGGDPAPKTSEKPSKS